MERLENDIRALYELWLSRGAAGRDVVDALIHTAIDIAEDEGDDAIARMVRTLTMRKFFGSLNEIGWIFLAYVMIFPAVLAWQIPALWWMALFIFVMGWLWLIFGD